MLLFCFFSAARYSRMQLTQDLTDWSGFSSSSTTLRAVSSSTSLFKVGVLPQWCNATCLCSLMFCVKALAKKNRLWTTMWSKPTPCYIDITLNRVITSTGHVVTAWLKLLWQYFNYSVNSVNTFLNIHTAVQIMVHESLSAMKMA